MSQVNDFINSGILDEYCLGLLLPGEVQEVERMAGLYPEVQQALDQAFRLLKSAENQAAAAGPDLKERILTTLKQLAEPQAFDLNNLPLINAYADSEQWLRTVAAIEPTGDFRNLYVHSLRNTDGVAQFILWVKQEVRPEHHHDERESFLILEGTCECRIGGEIIRLSAGDYIDIPLDVEHTVRVLSPEPVKALVQRVKIGV
ncbi:hypothetical protein GCM10027299_40350 [Larkinella ripae]